MERYIKSLILSIMMGISCKEYYGAILPKRKMRHGWIEQTDIFAFALGFMIISVSPIPPYILQPIRVIIILWIIGQIYFKAKWMYHLALSVFFGGIIWVLTSIVISVLSLCPFGSDAIEYIFDPVWCGILLFSMLGFSYRFKGKIYIFNKGKGVFFGIFPVFSIIILLIMAVWGENEADYSIRYIFVVGFGIASILIFYFICSTLIKDARMQSLQVENELVRNQMSMYQSMEQSYRQQQKYMHDYKNQLNCIQGLLEKGQVKESLNYIEELTGGIRKNTDYIDTNHVIVNVILNQKYQYALENGITMVINVNDLSCLVMKKEDLVILLSNLLDNAIEACKSIAADKIIQLKMVIEEESLILSVRNPMDTLPKMEGKRVLSSKRDKQNHGIGLLNIENVVRKNHGTSSIKCEDGYFSFSAMIPNGQGGLQ